MATWSGNAGTDISSAAGTVSRAGVRIGDVEREQAASALGAHLRAGRLDVGEYDERLQSAFAARTAADLTPLFTDLPGGSPLGPYPVSPQSGSGRRRHRFVPGHAFIVLLVIASVGWIAATHLPPFFLFPLFWFFVARRAFGPRRHGPAWPQG